MLPAIILNIVLFFILRTLYLIRFKSRNKFKKKCARTLIVIGSGGHTSEMIRHVKNLDPNLYQPRLYVMADTDTSSEPKIKELELEYLKITKTDYSIIKIPRSRHVNQSYITSIFTTLHSIIKCVPIVYSYKPDLILCNGPGTCIPICLISFVLKILFLSSTKIIFIESICRVKTISLSGKILLYFADQVLVQWPYLHEKYPKSIYIGRLT